MKLNVRRTEKNFAIASGVPLKKLAEIMTFEKVKLFPGSANSNSNSASQVLHPSASKFINRLSTDRKHLPSCLNSPVIQWKQMLDESVNKLNKQIWKINDNTLLYFCILPAVCLKIDILMFGPLSIDVGSGGLILGGFSRFWMKIDSFIIHETKQWWDRKYCNGGRSSETALTHDSTGDGESERRTRYPEMVKFDDRRVCQLFHGIVG